MCTGRGEHARGIALLETVLAGSDTPWVRYLACSIGSFDYCVVDDAARAVECAEQALTVTGGDVALHAAALTRLAQALVATGEYDRAREALAESARSGAGLGIRYVEVHETILGDIALETGRPEEAMARYEHSMVGAEASGDHLQVFFDLLGLCLATAAAGNDELAMRLNGLARAQAAHGGYAERILENHLFGVGILDASETRLGSERVRELRDSTQETPPGRCVAVALDLVRASASASASSTTV